MPDEILDDTAGGSSTATEPVADPSQATTPPAQPAPGQPPQSRTVPYERFQEVNSRMRSYETQLQRAGQTIDQLQRRMQQFEAAQTRGQALTPDQQRQYLEAGDAIEQILAAHPRLKALMGLMEHAPKLIEGYQGVSQLSEAQAQRHTQSAKDQIRQLAEKAGLPVTKDYLDDLTPLVARRVRAIDGGEQRYEQGDLSVLSEAFEAVVSGFLNHTRREAAAGLAATKAKTKALPPAATRGTAAGDAAPPKLVPGKEREYEEAMHGRARKRLTELLTG